MKKFWQGTPPVQCDSCHNPIKDEFSDQKTSIGPWAILCPSCSKWIGLGFGLGLGQRYRKQPDGRWLKVEG